MKSLLFTSLFLFSFPIYAETLEGLFLAKESKYCGVSKCEMKPVSSDKSCGQHWTGWHGCGGGHGNPCPSGCKRVGGTLGYSYRSVGFPPRCQEKNKYECIKSTSIMVKTGNVEQYSVCHHPANGVGTIKSSNGYLLNLSKSMHSAFAAYKKADSENAQFEKSVNLTLSYLEGALQLPSASKTQIEKLAELYKSRDSNITVDDIGSIISGNLALLLLSKAKSLKTSCN